MNTEEHYRKLLEKIDEIVGTDFMCDMEVRLIKPDMFTQEESRAMAEALALVYSLSHRIHCKSCNDRPL